MATEQVFPFSVVSVVEDVLQQHGARSRETDLPPKRVDEASLRRYQAAGWLRKTLGLVGGRDLPAEPTEEEFRHALRSGIILCSVMNKVQPGAVPKMNTPATDIVLSSPDGSFSRTSNEIKIEGESFTQTTTEEKINQNGNCDEESKRKFRKQELLVEQQQRDIQ